MTQHKIVLIFLEESKNKGRVGGDQRVSNDTVDCCDQCPRHQLNTIGGADIVGPANVLEMLLICQPQQVLYRLNLFSQGHELTLPVNKLVPVQRRQAIDELFRRIGIVVKTKNELLQTVIKQIGIDF